MNSIQKELALVSLDKLNAALAVHGAQQDSKADSLKMVAMLIDGGKMTLDDVHNAQPTPASRISSAPIDSATKAQIAGVVSEVASAVEQVSTVKNLVVTALETLNHRTAQDATALEKLSRSLTAKVDSMQAVDYSKVSAEIRAQVAAIIEPFKRSASPEVLAEIAAAMPVTERRLARDVFDGDLFYDIDGEHVDFSDFQVEVWNDPDAPLVSADYVFNHKHLHQTLIALDSALPDNIWLAGERGTGKTEYVTQIAARLKRKLVRVNFDEAIERADFIGGNSIEAGSVVWKAGVITQAIQHAGAIIILDEVGFARAQSIAVLHSLCEPSPHRALVVSETGQRIPVAPHVVFFGADNSNGHGDTTGNFAGVRDQNTAFLDRFGFTLRFEYLPFNQEASLISKRTSLPLPAAEVLVAFANVARERARMGTLTQPPSLRQLFAWARAVRKGAPVKMAFENAIVNKFPADCAAELAGVFAATVDVNHFKNQLRG
jgi:MoxR-like ATPase